MNKKKIKVTSRGMVLTSRGRVRTPIGPYMENVKVILAMIVRNNATVVEILDDGREIPLTVQNFDKDNSSIKVEEVPSGNEEKEETLADESKVPNQEHTNNRQLSRKERKKQEYERKVAEASKHQEQDKTPESVPEANNGETVIPTDAIEN